MADSRPWDTINTRTTTFCSLCGVLVDPWQDDLTVHPELNWLNEVRVVRTTRMVSDPFVTGVGYLNFHQEVCAPRDAARRYDEEHDQGQDDEDGGLGSFLQAHSHFNTSHEYWCYVFHDACWELLRDRIDPQRQIPANVVGRHLFALLYNTPTNGDGTLVPGHDYGGASQFQRPSRYGYFTVVNASKLPYLTGDPREALQNDKDHLWEAIEAASTPFKLPDSKLGNYSDSDIFCSLPNEIVMFIFEHLTSADLCNFRLASRYVADLSSPNLLPQDFWASRFGLGFEMDFVLAGPFFPQPPAPVDWRQLYIKAKATLSDSELFPGFRNRKRIWGNLHNISDALQLRIANEEWISATPYQDTNVNMLPGMSIASCISADVVLGGESTGCLATRDLDVSCRLFEAQIMFIPREKIAQGLKIAFSSIYLNGRYYISGMRTLPRTGSRDNKEELRVGFINPLKEHLISFPPGGSLRTVEVAVAAQGITGLRFIKKGPQGSSFFPVGDLTPRDPNSGIGKLEISEGSSCTGVAIGLDACKIISMSLTEKSDGPSLDSPFVVSVSEKLRHDVEIWNPSIPEDRPEWCPCTPNFTKLRPQAFNLCFDMDFGGANGQLLRQLTRVDMVMGSYPAVFMGMTFVYADGSQRSYGRRDNLIDKTINAAGVEQAFYIDGPNGEVIIKVMASYFRGKIVEGISFLTNKGRSAEFRLRGRVDCGSYPKPLDYVTIEPKKGELFTAFCAKVESPGSYFSAFGGRSQVISDNSLTEFSSQSPDIPHSLPITEEMLKSAEEMMAYPRGFAFTAADLHNVKRIRVSLGGGVGGEGRSSHSRSEKNISGLWLEYHDSQTPAILGQWQWGSQKHQPHEEDSLMRELELELEPGDRVTQMTTWHDYTNSYKRVKFGPIVKLRLGTARGITKDFLNPLSTTGKVCLFYRENPYEELHAILWGCNYEWDHVRALYASKAAGTRGRDPFVMVPSGPRSPAGAPWMVTEKAFLVETTRDGRRPNPVVAIEVSYKDLGSEPAGLTLVYAEDDAAEVTLGARGRRAQRIDLLPGEALTRMEVGLLRGNKVATLSFHTSANRVLYFRDNQGQAQLLHAKAAYRLAADDTAAATTTTDEEPSGSHCKNAKEIVCADGVAPGGAVEDEVKMIRVEDHPHSGPFVGFWAVPKRRDRSLRYLMFGPIFEALGGEGE